MNKTVYLTGKTRYCRPYHLDTGENLQEGSDIRRKIEETRGIYTSDILLPYSTKDDAEDFLRSEGVPMDGMMGNLLKRDPETKDIYYRVKRPNWSANMVDKETGEKGYFWGPPKVVDGTDESVKPFPEWDSEVLIGNGSDAVWRINVWEGHTSTKVRWDGLAIKNLVEFVAENKEGF